MDVFLARQPILTKRRTVYGYEVLFRSGLANVFDARDPNAASAHVIDNSAFVFGLSTMTAGTKAFINFTRDVLLEGYAYLLPPKSVVVEILEDVEPDDDVVEACRELRASGYHLALDDFVECDDKHPLLPYIDILKVDFLQLGDDERRAIPQAVGSRQLTLLAEKVENEQEFNLAVEAGYNLFQGYFFSRPTILTTRKPEGFPTNHLNILTEARKPELNFDRLERLIKCETSLVYKILRHVNSASYGLWNRVISVKHALLLMGEDNVRRFINLMVLGDIVGDRPPELIRMAAARASFCESIAQALRWQRDASELFLLGLFSLIDAILDQPIEDALQDLPLPAPVADALLGRESRYRVIYDLMMACEQGDWDTMDTCAATLELEPSVVAQSYFHSIEWAQSMLK